MWPAWKEFEISILEIYNGSSSSKCIVFCHASGQEKWTAQLQTVGVEFKWDQMCFRFCSWCWLLTSLMTWPPALSFRLFVFKFLLRIFRHLQHKQIQNFIETVCDHRPRALRVRCWRFFKGAGCWTYLCCFASNSVSIGPANSRYMPCLIFGESLWHNHSSLSLQRLRQFECNFCRNGFWSWRDVWSELNQKSEGSFEYEIKCSSSSVYSWWHRICESSRRGLLWSSKVTAPLKLWRYVEVGDARTP